MLKKLFLKNRYNIKCIEEECFSGLSKLKKIEIPPSIKRIYSNAFHFCPLETIIFKGLVELNDAIFYRHTLKFIYFANTFKYFNDMHVFYSDNFVNYENDIQICIHSKFHKKLIPNETFIENDDDDDDDDDNNFKINKIISNLNS